MSHCLSNNTIISFALWHKCAIFKNCWCSWTLPVSSTWVNMTSKIEKTATNKYVVRHRSNTWTWHNLQTSQTANITSLWSWLAKHSHAFCTGVYHSNTSAKEVRHSAGPCYTTRVGMALRPQTWSLGLRWELMWRNTDNQGFTFLWHSQIFSPMHAISTADQSAAVINRRCLVKAADDLYNAASNWLLQLVV